jgi:hypothetical protein
MVRTWLKLLGKQVFSGRGAKRQPARRSVALSLESLEGRLVPAVTSFVITCDAPQVNNTPTVVARDQTYNLTVTAMNGTSVATGATAQPTLTWTRPDGTTGTEGLNFTGLNGVYTESEALGQWGTYQFSVVWNNHPTVTSNVETIVGTQPKLGSISVSPVRVNPLPLGSVFAGQSFQLGITAYDTKGFVYNSTAPTSQLNPPGLQMPLWVDLESNNSAELPIPNHDIALVGGWAGVYLTTLGSSYSIGGGYNGTLSTVTLTATNLVNDPSLPSSIPPINLGSISGSTTITSVTTAFVFDVAETQGGPTRWVVTVPTLGNTGTVTIKDLQTGTTQDTGLTLNLLPVSGDTALYNWVLNRIQQHQGNPGHASALPSNVSSIILALTGDPNGFIQDAIGTAQ